MGVSIALLTSTTATALVCNYGNGTVTPMSYANGTWTAGTAITGFSNPRRSLYSLTHPHNCHCISDVIMAIRGNSNSYELL